MSFCIPSMSPAYSIFSGEHELAKGSLSQPQLTNKVLGLAVLAGCYNMAYNRSVMGKILLKSILKIQNKILLEKHFENTK
jgi:hypothetical protein